MNLFFIELVAKKRSMRCPEAWRLVDKGNAIWEMLSENVNSIVQGQHEKSANHIHTTMLYVFFIYT